MWYFLGDGGLSYLLHSGISPHELLPEIGNVVVESLHILLKVLPEHQQRFLHFTLELLRKQKGGEESEYELKK